MATTGRTPCDDEWFRRYFQQVFGRPPEGDSELDQHVVAWLLTAMDGATTVHPAPPERADQGVTAAAS